MSISISELWSSIAESLTKSSFKLETPAKESNSLPSCSTVFVSFSTLSFLPSASYLTILLPPSSQDAPGLPDITSQPTILPSSSHRDCLNPSSQLTRSLKSPSSHFFFLQALKEEASEFQSSSSHPDGSAGGLRKN